MKTLKMLGCGGLLLVSSGCIVAAAAVAAAATFGAIKYTENGAQRDFQTELTPTFEAVLASLRHLHYPVAQGASPGKTEGEIRAGDVLARVERHAGDFTRVVVKVGTFQTDDHQRRASLILEDVAKRLE